MRARNVARLRILVGVTLASAALGAALSWRDPAARLIGNAVASGLTGAVLAVFEIALQGPARARLQQLPVTFVLLLRVIVYGIVLAATPEFVAMAARKLAPSPALEEALGIGLGNAIIVAIAFNTFFLARALMGPSTLLAFLSGRYHRPRREERLVLFLDLHGSTALAERLGDLGFHRFLNRLTLDLSDPIVDAKGEIYRYVGDEIIVSWRVERGDEGSLALASLRTIDEMLIARRDAYLAEFGEVPRLRGGLHAGSLVIGEMGQLKRELVVLGDTMNTTARIVEACRQTGRDYIASAAALRLAGPLQSMRAEPLGPMPLRGKEEPVELFALLRDAPAVEPSASAAA
jgi:adenylate cyclase